MTPEALAQIAYEAHRNHIHNAYAGEGFGVLPWNGLTRFAQAAWIAAAQAVKANVLSGFTKVGEGEQA